MSQVKFSVVTPNTISAQHLSRNPPRLGESRNCEMPAGGVHGNDRTRLVEAQFYAAYSWCLNPLLSLRDLYQRLCEELNRYEKLQIGWQRAECMINVYLFICAIACTADDYLARQPCDLSSLSLSLPSSDWVVGLIQSILGLFCLLRSVCSERSTVRWRRRWDRCVDQVCSLLV